MPCPSAFGTGADVSFSLGFARLFLAHTACRLGLVGGITQASAVTRQDRTVSLDSLDAEDDEPAPAARQTLTDEEAKYVWHPYPLETDKKEKEEARASLYMASLNAGDWTQ